MEKLLKITSILCIITTSVNSFDHNVDHLCENNSHELEFKMMTTYFKDVFYITLIDTSVSEEHSISMLRCIKQSKHLRTIFIFDSIDRLQFKKKPSNSSVSSYPKVNGVFIKSNRSEVTKLIEKLSNQNPKIKVMIEFEHEKDFASNEILTTAYEMYKMLNIVIVKKKYKFSLLKFYNPFKNNGEFQVINITHEHDLYDIEEYQHERIKNLHKHQLRLYIFENQLSVKKIVDTKTSEVIFSYAIGELANALAEKMNFTPVYVMPKLDAISQYGFQLDNGTFTGALGALEYEQVDLVMNPRLISQLNTTKAEYLQPITTSSYKFIIKKRNMPRLLPLTILFKYDTTAKSICISMLALFPVIYKIVNKFETKLFEDVDKKRLKNERKRSLTSTFFYIFALDNGVSMRHTKLVSSRIIIFVILFYALIASSLYQGTIIKTLHMQSKFGHVLDIEHLFDDDYQFVVNHVMSGVLMQQSGNELSRNLRKVAENARIVTTDESIKLLLEQDYVASLLDTIFVTTHYLDRYYDNKTGENLLKVVPEKAFEFYIALMAPKTSPFTSSFNQIILKWIEAGLDNFHIRQATFDNKKFIYEKIKKGINISKNKLISLSLNDLLSAFILYCFMSVVCVIVFALEHLHFNIFKRK